MKLADKNSPIYPISVAARLLGLHPRTLRLYEEEGLITPARQGNKRYYSQSDIDWISCLRHLIHEEGISIPGIKKLLELTPCWEIKKCPPERREKCTAFANKVVPCWERASSACAKELNHCQECDVYIKAMKEARDEATENNNAKKQLKIIKVKKREPTLAVCTKPGCSEQAPA
ncbi:MerR family transcriptional regulator [Dissulfurimicrobium hydrothermale]|uniref:MerR family transcriptional regulator n=1 Tax=Dissulfurimicrobium hydrothermale TaxID=1750598 RepID=UPI001EDC1FE4|nr:MerR family transcriptional regulator [Dissulfurimicrobium hydrothermale]UKL12968.1 MerR family transcriptional regulator [Dissulfurimicrobium hydrothermale]